MLRTLSEGVPMSVTVTHVDGLVLARSGVSSFGELPLSGDPGNRARLVTDAAGKKWRRWRVFTEHVMKGRWDDVRRPTEQELKATTVLALPLEEVSRQGPYRRAD